MHKRHESRGFTLVELLVVIVVIALLATIAIIGYSITMKQAHDSKRQSDMTALRHTLETYYEKNGIYPPGCTQTNYSSTVGCTTYGSTSSLGSRTDTSMFADSAPGDQINASSNLSQIRTILPGLDESFGDPVNTSDQPIASANGGAYKYIYIGGFENTTASAINYVATANDSSGAATFACGLTFALNPTQVSSFVVGYYSEQDHTWHLFDGKHGVPATYSYPNPSDKRQVGCSGSTKAMFDERAK